MEREYDPWRWGHGKGAYRRNRGLMEDAVGGGVTRRGRAPEGAEVRAAVLNLWVMTTLRIE